MRTRFSLLVRLVIVLLFLHVQLTLANAADLKVLSSVAFKDVLQELAPTFETATRHRLKISYDLASTLKKRIETGENFDVVIITSSALEDLVRSQKVLGPTVVEIARTGVGVAVRRGAPKPDIGSSDALRRAILQADSIAYSKEGASGVYFATVLERLGIAETVKPKTKLVTSTSVPEFIAGGGAELGVQMISEILPVPGVELVGPLPPEFQKFTSFAAAVGTIAVSINAANDLIRFLVGPKASAVMTHKGMEADPRNVHQ